MGRKPGSLNKATENEVTRIEDIEKKDNEIEKKEIKKLAIVGSGASVRTNGKSYNAIRTFTGDLLVVSRAIPFVDKVKTELKVNAVNFCDVIKQKTEEIINKNEYKEIYFYGFDFSLESEKQMKNVLNECVEKLKKAGFIVEKI